MYYTRIALKQKENEKQEGGKSISYQHPDMMGNMILIIESCTIYCVYYIVHIWI